MKTLLLKSAAFLRHNPVTQYVLSVLSRPAFWQLVLVLTALAGVCAVVLWILIQIVQILACIAAIVFLGALFGGSRKNRR